ncbi:peptidylprolyl isomerase [Micromonospora sp. NPDC048999]|uniref:peptidylprolyl isomerase n=1 Tax=Micromonospora sp. NPDC048999 TaxID=3155391 RepID=UPI0033D58A81
MAVSLWALSGLAVIVPGTALRRATEEVDPVSHPHTDPPQPPEMPKHPDPPAMAYLPAAQPPNNRRGLIIGLVSAAAAMLLCGIVGCAGLGVYYLRQSAEHAAGAGAGTVDSDPSTPADPTGEKPTEQADSPAPATPASSTCGLVIPQARPGVIAVGPPDFANAPGQGIATMRITTNHGPIVVTMDRARTPCTVASFEHLAAANFFDQSSCHRLVTEGIFVLQCGDPTGTGQGGPDYQFADENLTGARYDRGVVAMANAGPGTNGSQFFIVFKDSTQSLPPDYTPFGEVTSGLDIVDRVAAAGHDDSYASTAGGGRPKNELRIQTVTLD